MGVDQNYLAAARTLSVMREWSLSHRRLMDRAAVDDVSTRCPINEWVNPRRSQALLTRQRAYWLWKPL